MSSLPLQYATENFQNLIQNEILLSFELHLMVDKNMFIVYKNNYNFFFI